MTSISGNFGFSTFGHLRTSVAGILPKRSETQFSFSPKASHGRSIKDEYIPSESVSRRSSYQWASKGLQNGKNQIPYPRATNKIANNPAANDNSIAKLLEADRVVLAEMEVLTQEIGGALNDLFFGKAVKIANPFTLMFSLDGQLSVVEDAAWKAIESDPTLSSEIKWLLEHTNRSLIAKKSGEDTEGILLFSGLTDGVELADGAAENLAEISERLADIVDKLAALKNVQEKIHDKSLLPEDGVRFVKNETSFVPRIFDLDGNEIFPFSEADIAKEWEANPGQLWLFEEKNKAFEGHDILNAIFPKIYSSVTSSKLLVDEYGYTLSVPGMRASTRMMEMINGQLVRITPVSGPFIEGQSTPNAIYSVDQSVFGGLTLEERDKFFAEVQKMLDKHGIKLDARKEVFGYSAPGMIPVCDSDEMVWSPGNWFWQGGLERESQSVISQTQRELFQREMASNPIIRTLFAKAKGVRNGTIADDTFAQQYSIRVTDNDGNRLANDRIIVEARNGNQIEMSVEQFSQMSRLEITKLLR
jgi:hypothetical protein